MLRDPISAQRAEADGILGVERTADIVFAARTVDRSAAAPFLDVGKDIALVNVSGLISRDLDQVAEYVAVVDHLRGLDLHVVILPHVSRSKGDDMLACAAVAERVGDRDVTFIAELLAPAQVRGLTELAVITVTGRMHLAVMSLWNGKPAITLATQGKVEGLMEMVDTRELCVVPRVGFSRTVIDIIDQVLPEDSAARQSIARALPHLVALAQANVSGLPARLPLEADGGGAAQSRPVRPATSSGSV
jgi:colanic acid/amylovoran biosynthesis protein